MDRATLVITRIAIGLELAAYLELSVKDDKVDGERPAALTLAVVAVTNGGGQEIAADLIGDSAAETSSS